MVEKDGGEDNAFNVTNKRVWIKDKAFNIVISKRETKGNMDKWSISK